jgi:hypothetical protein
LHPHITDRQAERFFSKENTSKDKAMVPASFAADSLTLGAHWIYDSGIIGTKTKRTDRMMDPLAGSCHEGKKKGGFPPPHSDDQALVLPKSIAQPGFYSAGIYREPATTEQ